MSLIGGWGTLGSGTLACDFDSNRSIQSQMDQKLVNLIHKIIIVAPQNVSKIYVFYLRDFL